MDRREFLKIAGVTAAFAGSPGRLEYFAFIGSDKRTANQIPDKRARHPGLLRGSRHH